ncbi:hypothetical protein [Methylopila sp. 73B]|uniref:hypothetical protein n=1 Tax=Methylopila sp. 73B TaxID=1120792 RepID=UPI0003629FD8|nr:hypothetical protein [Methylopila sp. 73B]
MPGVAVKSLDAAGGAQLAGGQDWFRVEGQLVVVIGDPVTPHSPQKTKHSGSPEMVGASGWMSLDGKAVCRAGDEADCGHASTGRGWFSIA